MIMAKAKASMISIMFLFKSFVKVIHSHSKVCNVVATLSKKQAMWLLNRPMMLHMWVFWFLLLMS